MIAYTASRLSAHMGKTDEGFLICLAAPLCRSGIQKYRASELGFASDDTIDVIRPVSEVTSPRTVASFEGKPVCGLGHPPRLLDPSNASAYSRGHVQHVRVGPPLDSGDIPLLGDLVITDSNLISQILDGGVRQLSCGYQTDYISNADGTFTQTAILGNHVAVLSSLGRAGNAEILDSRKKEPMTREEELAAKMNELTLLLNAETATRRRRVTDRDAPSLAGQMLSDAKRLTERLATVNEGPASLHSFIMESAHDLPPADSIARDELKRASGAAFEEVCAAAGRRARGEPEDCRASLRRGAVDSEESFEQICRRRRRVLLGR